MLQLAQYGTEKFSNKIRIEIIDITNWTILLVSLDKTFKRDIKCFLFVGIEMNTDHLDSVV